MVAKMGRFGAWIAMAAVAGWLGAACGDDPTEPGGGADGGGIDVVDPGFEVMTPDVDEPDVPVAGVDGEGDAADAGGEDASGDAGGEADVPTGPEPGALGWPCGDNDDCNSGWCVASAEGDVCTTTCTDECPPSWTCRPLLQGGDPVFLCLPTWLYLCDPCEEDSDCSAGDSDTGHYCLDRGAAGKFCGGKCEDGQCPEGYECAEELSQTGLVVEQCVPVGGAECACSPLATSLSLSTTCTIENEFGACEGDRQCTNVGLSPCTAEVPGPEQCNGQDDDCDGATDELEDGYQCGKTNEFGTCFGSGVCVGGVEQCDAPDALPEQCNGLDDDCDGETDEDFPDSDEDGTANCLDDDDDDDGLLDEADNCPLDANPGQDNHDGDTQGDACDEDDDNDGVVDVDDCEPKDQTISPDTLELCDGVDNDCDSLTDEDLCDDGNPCTDDSCDSSGACIHANNALECDDGSVCTQVDLCKDGTCQGFNPLICNDENPCTTDTCEPVVGCLTEFNTAPCEDGEPCTKDDACNLGVCVAGDWDTCDDGNPCTNDACQMGFGCTYANGSGSYCQTGDDGCPDGICQNGFCTFDTTKSCIEEIEVDPFGLCTEDVPGKCGSNGACIPTSGSANCTCGPCASFCVCCGIFSLCLDFLFQ